jgi:glycosyltransferase involved in cell wall biosynthesis
MKVLHLTTDSQIAGAERLLILTARHGLMRGDQHVVCTLRERGPLHRAIEAEGGTAFSLDLRHGSQLGNAIRRLLRVLEREQVDLLHTHLFHAGVLAWVASHFASLPVRVHTRHYERLLHQYGKGWEVLLDRCATRAADQIVAISDAARSVLVDLDRMPADRICVVHNGIDPPLCYRASRPRNDAPTLAAVATLAARKGHQYLIEAMPLIRRRLPGVRLRICGEGPQRPALQRLVEALGLGAAVELTGYIEDVLPVLAGADLMVHPSVEEGFGIALLEGMSQECAVVASRAGGIPEVVEDGVTGLLVPPASPPHLAAAVVELLADPARRCRMGGAGRRRLEQHFTIGAMLDHYGDLYARVLSSTAHEQRKAA